MGRLIVPTFITGGYRPCRQTADSCISASSTWEPALERLLLSGLLGDLFGTVRTPPVYQRRSQCRRGWSQSCPCGRAQEVRRPWVHTLDLSGYEPSDISVKVEAEKVVVHARREERDGDDFSLSEKLRSVIIPEGVDEEKVSCFLADGGKLIIKGVYAPKRQSGASEGNKTTEDEASTTTAKKTANEEESPRAEKTTETLNGGLDTGLASDGTNDENREQLEEPIPEDIKILSEDSSETENKHQQKIGETEEDENMGLIIEMQEKSEAESPETSDNETTYEATDEVKITEVDSLAPLMDETQVVESDDNARQFQVRINLQNFKPDDVSVRRQDNDVVIDARKEWNCEGIYTSQEVHRTYALPPETRKDGDATAKMNDSGLLLVSVPMDSTISTGANEPAGQNAE